MIRTIKNVSFIPVWVVPGTVGTDPTIYTDESDWLQPYGYDDFFEETFIADHLFTALSEALDDVSVRIHGYGDLDAADEFGTVVMNGVDKGTVHSTTGFAGNVLSDETIIIPKADWNTLRGAPISPDPANSIRIVVTPELTVNRFPELEDPNTGCISASQGAPVEECGLNIDISYRISEGTDFQYGTGPAFQRWRSLDQQIKTNGTVDYLWADMKWDNHLNAYQIVMDSKETHYNGLRPGDAGELSTNNPGKRATRAVVPYQYAPKLIRFHSQPECGRVP